MHQILRDYGSYKLHFERATIFGFYWDACFAAFVFDPQRDIFSYGENNTIGKKRPLRMRN